MGAKDLLIDAKVQETCFHGRHIAPQILAGLNSPDAWRLKDYEARQVFSFLGVRTLKELEEFTPQQVSLAKRNNVDMATNIAREARRLLGANGILAEYASMRHMANLESVYTYEGTHDVHGLILGQEITGIAAY